MKYTVRATSRFRKGYKRMQKSRLEMSCLDEVIAMLALAFSAVQSYLKLLDEKVTAGH